MQAPAQKTQAPPPQAPPRTMFNFSAMKAELEAINEKYLTKSADFAARKAELEAENAALNERILAKTAELDRAMVTIATIQAREYINDIFDDIVYFYYDGAKKHVGSDTIAQILKEVKKSPEAQKKWAQTCKKIGISGKDPNKLIEIKKLGNTFAHNDIEWLPQTYLKEVLGEWHNVVFQ